MKLAELMTAHVLMSSPVRTISPGETIKSAQSLLLRYGHSGLCVVQEAHTLIGIISRRDIDTALRHGFKCSTVSDFMSQDLKSVSPNTSIVQIQQLMLTYSIGRIPVIDKGKLVGIITRTDLLRGGRFIKPASTKSQQNISQNNSSNPARAFTHSSLPNSFLPDRPPDIFAPPSRSVLCQQLAEQLPDTWAMLMQLANIADQKGWSLYIVGGAVRDLLIALLAKTAVTDAPPNTDAPSKISKLPLTLNDIDLVVEGAGKGAGVALAQEIQANHPQIALQIYGQFQTAALTWQTNTGKPLALDIATARTEFYPYPAANPEVEASSIHQDLYRRDFTINAMAICLNGTDVTSSRFQQGQLIDFFGGWIDIQRNQVKVIHSNSFIEDPTRIFRAVRFAARLGFELDSETARFMQYAISSGIYDQMRTRIEKTPALQSRLAAELQYLLSEPTWACALTHASQAHAFRCIHDDITFTPTLQQQLSRMHRWITKLTSPKFVNKFGISALGNAPAKWLMLLELIIAQLDSLASEQVALTLNLSVSSQHRLKNLHRWEADITKQMPAAKRPSQLFSLLQAYERSALLLIGARHPYTLGPQIWQHIVQLSNQPPLLTGRHLKQMGYSPSPLFRKILTDVSNLSLDGELTSIQDAEAYVLAHYPNS